MKKYDLIAVPTVHLNGTSKQALLDQLQEAIGAIEDAGKALARAAPHGRDYYIQKDNPINAAMDQHDARMEKLRSIVRELEFIAEQVVDQP